MSERKRIQARKYKHTTTAVRAKFGGDVPRAKCCKKETFSQSCRESEHGRLHPGTTTTSDAVLPGQKCTVVVVALLGTSNLTPHSNWATKSRTTARRWQQPLIHPRTGVGQAREQLRAKVILPMSALTAAPSECTSAICTSEPPQPV